MTNEEMNVIEEIITAAVEEVIEEGLDDDPGCSFPQLADDPPPN